MGRPGLLRALERIALALLLAFASGAFDAAFRHVEVGPFDRHHPLFSLGLVLLLLLRLQRPLRRCAREHPVLLVVASLPVAIALASPLWSIVPLYSLEVALALLASSLVGLYCALCIDRNEFIDRLALALGGAAIVSALTIGLCPDFGVMHGNHEGAWQGLYGNRNFLGPPMVLLILLLLVLRRTQRHAPVGSAALIALAAAEVLGARGRTAIALLVLMLFALWLFGARQAADAPKRRRMLRIGSAALVLVGIAVWIGAERGLSWIGRDLTFSGRTRIWRAVLGVIEERPALGWGLATFWRHSPRSWLLGWEVGAPFYHAHNGFLDAAIDLGLVGLASLLLFFAVFVVRAFRHAARGNDALALLPLLLLLFVVTANLPESRLLNAWQLYWILGLWSAFDPLAPGPAAAAQFPTPSAWPPGTAAFDESPPRDPGRSPATGVGPGIGSGAP